MNNSFAYLTILLIYGMINKLFIQIQLSNTYTAMQYSFSNK